MQEKWAEISENLKKLLDPGTFKVWIAPLRVAVRENGLHLFVQNAFVADWLEARMAELLREAAAPVLGLASQALELRIEIAPVPAAALVGDGVAASKEDGPARQLPLPLPPGAIAGQHQTWRYSFEDFEVGLSNSVAVAAAKDVCGGGGVRALFVNSAPGLGKTHLTQAVGKVVSQSSQGGRIAYMTAEDFARHFVSALKRREIESFRERLAELDVLLLEDVHFLQGKEKIQEIALATLKTLQERNGRVIFTSSFSPRELQEMDTSLVSYFCSGILTRMDKPSRDMRRRILMRKAGQFQMSLPDDVCELLASRLRGDVRQLESCLNSLIFKARLLNCGLNPQLAMDVLEQYAGAECGADLNTIIRLVCEIFGLTERQMVSRSRRRDCVSGRNTAYYLARKHTELSLEEIGSTFNRRHSTVIKGITSVEREISKESTLGRQLIRAVRLIERNAGLSSTTA
ncbi:MAG: chromosomal replication initiator protein DnaA [Desulfovibrio sp.]|jgi:chromosomal replication initiator protein|nr:chromosomal replication initiator protein DnaA [Desulfovibrio sp.]